MSPRAGEMLISQIMPMITAAVASGKVQGMPTEDMEEVTADTMAQAAAIIDAAEANGSAYTPGTIARFALQSAKSGRRSTGASRTDACAPGCRMDNDLQFVSMDEETVGEDGNEGTLHEALASRQEDPATCAGRVIDWDDVLPSLSDRQRRVLEDVAQYVSGKDTAAYLGISTGRVVQLKREIGNCVRETWGENALSDAITAPAWRAGLRAEREQRTCRRERLACHA